MRFFLTIALLAALPGASVRAENPAPSTVPDRREVWVPTPQLKDVLAKYPNAVVLSREQYETLLRDAKADDPRTPILPRRAVLASATYDARLVGAVVEVRAALLVNVLTDEWAQVVLGLDGASIGSLQVDGEAALLPAGGTASPQIAATASALLLRGRGERRIALTFSVPVASAAGRSQLRTALPAAATSLFTLELPADQRVESTTPLQVTPGPGKTTVSAAPSPTQPVVDLSWRSAGGGNQALEPLVLANGLYTIDAEKVRVEYGLAIETQRGSLAGRYQVALPAGARVLQVSGDEVARWEVANGFLRITLLPGERSTAHLWLALDFPSLAGAPSATLTLPVPRLEGLARMEGVFSIIDDPGISVKGVTVGANTRPTQRAVEQTAGHIVSYRFHAPPDAPRVTVEAVRPRFSADLDTQVEFRPEAIFLERTLTLHQEKGEVFQIAVTLPAGEEILSVRTVQDTEPDWRVEDGKLRLRWSGPLPGKEPAFKIRTRVEPDQWTQLAAEGQTFTLGDARIEGVDKLTGYIALQADESFRLEAEPSETLERRDGRTTPVRGEYAWFRRADFSLKVKVVKRTGEILATLTGYALPLAGVLDLHAQLDYQFLRSGARSVRVRVPADLAANFHFDGPQIAERNLAGDTWTIVFQKELTGRYALQIAAQVAVPMAANATPGEAPAESRFSTAVPVIVPLDAARSSGVWAIEANTETEITFTTRGLNELDSLLAPRLPDYQPRHRVIGVFAWLGQEYSLALSGVRHAPASVLTTIVDRLELDTVVSPHGAERSQAVYLLRTTGAQYLEVQLPEKARLLSLTVDEAVVKPVGERAEHVRVPLPARRESSPALTVSIFYETPGGEWRRAGGYAATAPRVAREIPVLRSLWRLHLPDGFDYTALASNLRVPEMEAPLPLVGELLGGALSLPVMMIASSSQAPDFAPPTSEVAAVAGKPGEPMPPAAMESAPRPSTLAKASTPAPAAPALDLVQDLSRADIPLQKAQRVAGLLPMKLELPKTGRVLEFEGLTAAERVELHYEDWWSRARRLWLWFVGGAALAWFLAGPRPWWRTAWVILLLSFFPYGVMLETLPICNALLAGWLLSLVLQRLAARFLAAPQRQEVLA